MITIHKATQEELGELMNAHHENVFKEEFDFNIRAVLSDEEIEAGKKLRQNEKHKFTYRLIAKINDEPVGWSFGFQTRADACYMCNSAVLPNYRRKGVYKALMKEAVKVASNEGFQTIYSEHKLHNNPIIIAKLKAGFEVTGLSLNDSFGNLLRLTFYTNKKRKDLLHVRSGLRKPSAEDLNLIE